MLEGDEHGFQALVVDADAGVVYRAGEPDQLAVEHLPAGFDADAALLGEFQRVAHQVEQDLANPRRVADHLQLFHAGR
ncbi:hypothetical protein D3C81_1867840 [compost metagenome]